MDIFLFRSHVNPYAFTIIQKAIVVIICEAFNKYLACVMRRVTLINPVACARQLAYWSRSLVLNCNTILYNLFFDNAENKRLTSG